MRQLIRASQPRLQIFYPTCTVCDLQCTSEQLPTLLGVTLPAPHLNVTLTSIADFVVGRVSGSARYPPPSSVPILSPRLAERDCHVRHQSATHTASGPESSDVSLPAAAWHMYGGPTASPMPPSDQGAPANQRDREWEPGPQDDVPRHGQPRVACNLTCQHCNKRFERFQHLVLPLSLQRAHYFRLRRVSSLETHLLTHAKARRTSHYANAVKYIFYFGGAAGIPHDCPAPGCNKRFSTKSNLTRHIRNAHERNQPIESGTGITPIDPIPYSAIGTLTRLEGVETRGGDVREVWGTGAMHLHPGTPGHRDNASPTRAHGAPDDIGPPVAGPSSRQ